uniref:hAT-like transposase RNase-H fold domain-containing protein n=1 Tax=Chenopodium quinoa TaxID=63459 RepID=A0A803N3Y6_CHEQI
MACKMYEKFGKYWSEFSTFMVVAVVLDPRYKLQCVNWGYMRIYGQHSVEYELEFSKVKDALRRLYEAYASSHSSSSNVIPTANASNANEASDDFMMVNNYNMDPQMAMLCGAVMKLKVGDNDDAPQTSSELSEFDENASSNII